MRILLISDQEKLLKIEFIIYDKCLSSNTSKDRNYLMFFFVSE